MAAGWPLCLGALAATVLLIEEAETGVSNSQLAQYQGLLCENLWVTLTTVRTLNSATFLPTEEGKLDHDCSEVTDEVVPATRPA